MLRTLLRPLLVALVLASVGISTSGCVRTGSGRTAEVPMGSWPAWQDLTPLIDVAEAHVEPPVLAILKEAQALLRDGKAKSADQVLSKAANSSARHWIAVARANVAAMNFTTCIRGVAWRLPDSIDDRVRAVDYNPETKVGPGDLSVEALLTNLDDAVDAGKTGDALTTQARIARVRVTGFVASCPPNPEVEKRATAIMNSDLATLAAESHLTPDLAYMWAGIQIQTYSGAAARPFLLQALEGGFDDPSVTYMLAAIAFEQSELAQAEELAATAATRYAELGDKGQQSQVAFLRGEIALADDAYDRAQKHYEAALKLIPNHTGAMLGLAEVERERSGAIAAGDRLHESIVTLMQADVELDLERAAEVIDDLESLVIIANADTIELAQITRDALLLEIDSEPDPYRRGLRYFYAAALEVRLGEYDQARGHATTAELEFEDSPLPIANKADPRAFLDQLAEASP